MRRATGLARLTPLGVCDGTTWSALQRKPTVRLAGETTCSAEVMDELMEQADLIRVELGV